MDAIGSRYGQIESEGDEEFIQPYAPSVSVHNNTNNRNMPVLARPIRIQNKNDPSREKVFVSSVIGIG